MTCNIHPLHSRFLFGNIYLHSFQSDNIWCFFIIKVYDKTHSLNYHEFLNIFLDIFNRTNVANIVWAHNLQMKISNLFDNMKVFIERYSCLKGGGLQIMPPPPDFQTFLRSCCCASTLPTKLCLIGRFW